MKYCWSIATYVFALYRPISCHATNLSAMCNRLVVCHEQNKATCFGLKNIFYTFFELFHLKERPVNSCFPSWDKRRNQGISVAIHLVSEVLKVGISLLAICVISLIALAASFTLLTSLRNVVSNVNTHQRTVYLLFISLKRLLVCTWTDTTELHTLRTSIHRRFYVNLFSIGMRLCETELLAYVNMREYTRACVNTVMISIGAEKRSEWRIGFERESEK